MSASSAPGGRLDVVVNNAGATLVGALEETSTEEARWLIETNLLERELMLAVSGDDRRLNAGGTFTC